MHISEEERRAQATEIKNIYFSELSRRTLDAYKDVLEEQTLTQADFEAKIHAYYNLTVPTLQNYYSRYTQEWERYESFQELATPILVNALRRMLPRFAKNYDVADLNVRYYIEQLSSPDKSDQEKACIKDFFFENWYRVLNKKEYDHKMLTINHLCDNFYLLQSKVKDRLVKDTGISRLEWHALNLPYLHEKLIEFEKIMLTNPHINEIIQLLGQRSNDFDRTESLSGIPKHLLVNRSTQSDIIGISQGHNLSSLLPIEYCYLSDPTMTALFMQRYIEKRLQVFEHQSEDIAPSINKSNKVPGYGPFIICVDTSYSMTEGKRETLSKSAILAIAMLTEKTHRKCHIINFSDHTISLTIEELGADLPKIADFLNKRFEGGTDLEPALEEASNIINTDEYHHSDILIISDFEFTRMSSQLEHTIATIKERNSSIYGLVLGKHPEEEYLEVCDKCWYFEEVKG